MKKISFLLLDFSKLFGVSKWKNCEYYWLFIMINKCIFWRDCYIF